MFVTIPQAGLVRFQARKTNPVKRFTGFIAIPQAGLVEFQASYF